MLKKIEKYGILEIVGKVPHNQKGGQHNVGGNHNHINCFCNLFGFLAVYLGNIKTNLCVFIPKYCKCSKKNWNDRASSKSNSIRSSYSAYSIDTIWQLLIKCENP